MSGRRLGGGRILGTGKGLAPSTPSSAPRSSSPLPPSESNVSLGSVSLSPPASGSLPDLEQAIGASISVGYQPNSNVADATDLICPICNEEMVTLLQLNRHIDDSHPDLAEEDQVKSWLDKQVLRAKRFQPLSLLNQKLRGLEVFESNESQPVQAHIAQATAGRTAADAPVDPDELITRKHWQRSTNYDVCTDPTCGKRLGSMNGIINCRHCGRLFCEEHSMYQMKLSRSAHHEPVRGFWARVCETCYKSRDGYNDHNGVVVDRMGAFSAIRREKVERHNLEVSRLEKRLTKLTRLLASPPDALPLQNGSLLSPMSALTGQINPRKLLEQSIVTWEDDGQVLQCPFCQQEFGSWTFRRHHCRICGRVVCADPVTRCSWEVSLDVASTTPSKMTAEKSGMNGATDSIVLNVRMCRDCNHTIFSNRDFTTSIQHKPPDQKAYETLRQFEKGIRQLLPSFHRALHALQPPSLANGGMDLSKPPPTHAQIQEASKLRKRLIDSFGKYGLAAKRLRDLQTDSRTQKKLQQAVYAYASSFLHTNMLPLKSLPKLLRHQSPSRLLVPSTTSSLRHSELASDAASAASDTTVVTQLESEEKDLRERLVVLEEQKFMVEHMIRSATGARRFEEVGALARNVDELDKDIGDLKASIGQLEQRWEGVYRNGAS